MRTSKNIHFRELNSYQMKPISNTTLTAHFLRELLFSNNETLLIRASRFRYFAFVGMFLKANPGVLNKRYSVHQLANMIRDWGIKNKLICQV